MWLSLIVRERHQKETARVVRLTHCDAVVRVQQQAGHKDVSTWLCKHGTATHPAVSRISCLAITQLVCSAKKQGKSARKKPSPTAHSIHTRMAADTELVCSD